MALEKIWTPMRPVPSACRSGVQGTWEGEVEEVEGGRTSSLLIGGTKVRNI